MNLKTINITHLKGALLVRRVLFVILGETIQQLGQNSHHMHLES